MAKPVYTELSPIEHCLLRPDTYIGAVRPVEREDWLLVSDKKEEKKMIYRSFLSNPGMERLFIECQSNAIDNAWRSSEAGIKQTRIEFELSDSGWASVKNDGLIIPLERHAESGLWNPEFIFGRLRTSSNYDDTEERKTSGKNGLGSKLNNIYSFSVFNVSKNTVF
jgi:DNA topoisomerase-2